MAEQTFVIVGGGLAAAKAAETLRDEGFDGAIHIIAAEPHLPYERPPLSKGVLTGADAEEVIYPHDANWYRDKDVTVHASTTATGIDRADRRVQLDTGDAIGYHKLLLATGSTPRMLPIPGADLAGVHYLRTLKQSEELAEALRPGGRSVAIIGAGWIGLEVAAAARGYGNDVTVVEPQPQPLRAALGDELGAVFAGLHRDHGVKLMLSTGATEITGTPGGVAGVVTDSGETVPADVVVIGVGAVPAVELAQRAGLDVGRGVLTDASLRTSDENIYAAGDIAESMNPVYGQRVRVEHWANALNGGPAAAKAMLGRQVSYDQVPYFFTDQYDLGMEFNGHLTADSYDRVVYRGDQAAREFVAFWLSGDRVVAGMNVNVWDVSDAVGALIRAGGPVDIAKLTDPEVPLDQVSAG